MLVSYDGFNLDKSNFRNLTKELSSNAKKAWCPGDLIVRITRTYEGLETDDDDVGIIVWINRSPEPTRRQCHDLGIIWSSSRTKAMSEIEVPPC